MRFQINSNGFSRNRSQWGTGPKIFKPDIHFLTLQHVNVWMNLQIFILEWISFGLTKIEIWVQNLLIPVHLEEELIWKH